MRLLACLFLATCPLPAPAAGGSCSRKPVEDVGIPFRWEWGYDWDERRPRLVVSYTVPTTGLSP